MGVDSRTLVHKKSCSDRVDTDRVQTDRVQTDRFRTDRFRTDSFRTDYGVLTVVVVCGRSRRRVGSGSGSGRVSGGGTVRGSVVAVVVLWE